MSAGLRTLLAGIVDYAGLFPPARLPLEPALRDYIRHGQESAAWMLGRFVIGAARLNELEPLAELFPQDTTLTFSALGRGGASTEEFLTGLAADLKDIDAFHARHGRAVRVDAFEVKLPPDVLTSADALSGLLDEAGRRLDRTESSCLPVFFETPPEAAPAAALALQQRRNRGFKLRCGGLQAADFPTTAQVAAALTACVEWDVPFKATAGLHHPLPQRDEAIGVRMHGFVNLTVAGVLAHALGLNADEVAVLLDDDQPGDFAFDDGGLRWRDLSATIGQIAAARLDAVVSFGSCSFEEPCADLRALGWLSQASG